MRLEREFLCRRGLDEGFTLTDEFEFSSPQAFGTALVTFSAWRAIDGQTLEIGSGAERLLVRLEAKGGTLVVRSESIDENLPGGHPPTRLGLDFTQPVAKGRIRLTITRAAPLLAAPPAVAAAPDSPLTIGLSVAALLVQLPPGNYTFQVSAKANATGTVLGEAYELP